jgi:hypothetical protein
MFPRETSTEAASIPCLEFSQEMLETTISHSDKGHVVSWARCEHEIVSTL